MRLTCPNCKAQYEVDDSVIPDGGRDVQCSACGHTWYQYPRNVALDMRAADLDDEDEDENDGTAATPPSGATPKIDKTVLDVLREEAEREMRERRRGNGGGLETQGDLGLVSRPQRRGTATDRPAGDDTDEAETPAHNNGSSRRNLLPDIEELSSTLESGSEPRHAADDVAGDLATERSGGFGAGFATVALVGIAMIAVYVFAGPIAQAVPILAEPLTGYLTLVDALRAWLADALRGLLERVNG